MESDYDLFIQANFFSEISLFSGRTFVGTKRLSKLIWHLYR